MAERRKLIVLHLTEADLTPHGLAYLKQTGDWPTRTHVENKMFFDEAKIVLFQVTWKYAYKYHMNSLVLKNLAKFMHSSTAIKDVHSKLYAKYEYT